MDTFRLTADAVRRLLPDAAKRDAERDDTERRTDRVREVEPRVADEERGEQDS